MIFIIYLNCYATAIGLLKNFDAKVHYPPSPEMSHWGQYIMSINAMYLLKGFDADLFYLLKTYIVPLFVYCTNITI